MLYVTQRMTDVLQLVRKSRILKGKSLKCRAAVLFLSFQMGKPYHKVLNEENQTIYPFWKTFPDLNLQKNVILHD